MYGCKEILNVILRRTSLSVILRWTSKISYKADEQMSYETDKPKCPFKVDDLNVL